MCELRLIFLVFMRPAHFKSLRQIWCVKRTVAAALLPVKCYYNKFLSFFYYVPELISVADYEYFGGKYYCYADETDQVDFGVDSYKKDICTCNSLLRL